MKLKKNFFLIGIFIVLIVAGNFLVSCTNQSLNGMIVFTRVPVKNINIDNDNMPHSFKGANLMAVNPDNQESEKINLTPGFYSACSPRISYDATHLLFMGKKNKQDKWQIWEMNLDDNTSRQITKCKMSCYTPAYLPGGKIVFSKKIKDTNYNALFSMKIDGSGMAEQLTFHPNSDYVTSILKDGRILINSQQIIPEKGEKKYLAMRPNGTKAILFYADDTGSDPGFRTSESNNGKIFFVEKEDKSNDKTDIVSVLYNRPLHSKINYTSDITGNFYSVLSINSENLIVSFRNQGDINIGIYNFSTTKKSVENPIYKNAEYHCFEPVFVKPYLRPRNLPSGINMAQTTGLFLCTNINLTAATDTISPSTKKAIKVEILGLHKSLGIVNVEEDGSFYLKVDADTPVRFQTLDENNNTISDPSDWIWIRPFERRGCVGCHENPELVPHNIVPMAVSKWPVLITSDTSKSADNSQTTKVSEMK